MMSTVATTRDKTVPVAGAKHPQLATAIGERIREALRLAGMRTLDDAVRVTGLQDRALRRYLKGTHIPLVPALMVLSEACQVSIDWLVFGREWLPAAYYEWLQTPLGGTAREEARAALRSLPLHGYPADVEFYDRAFLAWGAGVRDPEDILRTARQTIQHS